MRSLLGRFHRPFARGNRFGIALMNNSQQKLNIAGFAGSARARDILRAADSGSDSVDILTVGDSNIGFNGYGYAGGIYKAMQPLCTEYATGIVPGALSGGAAAFTGTILGDGLTFNYQDLDLGCQQKLHRVCGFGMSNECRKCSDAKSHRVWQIFKWQRINQTHHLADCH